MPDEAAAVQTALRARLVLRWDGRAGDETVVELIHEGVPNPAHEQISAGWETNYLGSMKEMFAG